MKCGVKVCFAVFFQKKLGLYDFSFGAWPVDYKWKESKAKYVDRTELKILSLNVLSISLVSKSFMTLEFVHH